MFRIGNGLDVHAFIEGKPLVLGGVDIPYEQGLLAHSDGDLLCHSIADALLGALAWGDIGKFFPDSDPKYKDMKSTLLLEEVYRRVRKEGYEIVNLDSTILCETPRLAEYIRAIRESLAQVLGVRIEFVSVKASTTEGLGFLGRKEGIAVYSQVLLTRGYDATTMTKTDQK